MSSEIWERYLGWLITGRSVGDKPPYRCAGRAHRPVDDGWAEPEWDQIIPPNGPYENEREAAKAGLEAAKLWIHTVMDPGQQDLRSPADGEDPMEHSPKG